MRALKVIVSSPRSAWTLIGVLQFSLTLTHAYNAAGVWGVEPNATYHPLLSNLMFQSDLRAVDTAFRASGVQGLYQISWTEPRPEMKSLGYCPSPIPRFHNTTACVTLRKDFDEYWQETLKKLQPWRRNGTVVGIFLGDEQCYHGASMRNLTYVTKRIRNDWPEALIYLNEAQDLLMCNFNRMNESFFDSDTEHNCWPAELDWLGFDVYGYNLNTTFDAARATYENNIFARMATTGQSVVATTVGHGGHTAETADWTLAQYDNYCVQNAERWFSYAEAEPRVAGIFPWYWRTGTYYPAPPSTPRINISFGLGLDRLPRCAAAYTRWGKKVRAHTPRGRVRLHQAGRPLCKAGVTKVDPWKLDPAWTWCDTHH